MEYNFSNDLSPEELERLAILIEECSEVQQIACKILRHGYNSYNPNDRLKITNTKLLETELGHLLFAIEWLQNAKDVDATKIRYSAIDKAKNIQRYLHFNNIPLP